VAQRGRPGPPAVGVRRRPRRLRPPAQTPTPGRAGRPALRSCGASCAVGATSPARWTWPDLCRPRRCRVGRAGPGRHRGRHRRPVGRLVALAVATEGPFAPVPGGFLHVVGMSLPGVQSGYTLRTHYTAVAQRGLGVESFVVTQMGFRGFGDDYGGRSWTGLSITGFRVRRGVVSRGIVVGGACAAGGECGAGGAAGGVACGVGFS
jgi:hypothetical protein